MTSRVVLHVADGAVLVVTLGPVLVGVVPDLIADLLARGLHGGSMALDIRHVQGVPARRFASVVRREGVVVRGVANPYHAEGDAAPMRLSTVVLDGPA
jgi:hypothetical protein